MSERDMNKLKINLARLKNNWIHKACFRNWMQLVLLVLTGNHHLNTQGKIFIKVHWLKINIKFAGFHNISYSICKKT